MVNRINELTTFGFIMSFMTVRVKIAHLVWFLAVVFRTIREFPDGITFCSRRESEIAGRRYLFLLFRCVESQN